MSAKISTGNIILNSEILKVPLWDQEWDQGAHYYHFYSAFLEFLTMQQGEKKKGGINIWNCISEKLDLWGGVVLFDLLWLLLAYT